MGSFDPQTNVTQFRQLGLDESDEDTIAGFEAKALWFAILNFRLPRYPISKLRYA